VCGGKNALNLVSSPQLANEFTYGEFTIEVFFSGVELEEKMRWTWKKMDENAT
jgi:hypothetical protein